MLVLAAAKSLAPYITWVGILIGAVMVAGVALLIFRARVLKKSEAESQAGLLDDLRAMRDRGEITPEEFVAAKASIAARLSGRMKAGPARSGSADRPPSAPPGPDR